MKRSPQTSAIILLLLAATGPLGAATVRYTYDALNRLTQVTYIDNTTITYTYDKAGNWTTNAVIIAIDSVGDGIPDWWRALYFEGSGTTTDHQSCATCDFDGDGFSNLQELLAGTDPKDPKNAMRLFAVDRAGPDFTFSITTVSNKFYVVEYKNDLGDASWTALTDTFAGTGGTIQFIDPTGADRPRRFYRIRLLE